MSSGAIHSNLANIFFLTVYQCKTVIDIHLLPFDIELLHYYLHAFPLNAYPFYYLVISIVTWVVGQTMFMKHCSIFMSIWAGTGWIWRKRKWHTESKDVAPNVVSVVDCLCKKVYVEIKEWACPNSIFLLVSLRPALIKLLA
jgi:hypothetical protein